MASDTLKRLEEIEAGSRYRLLSDPQDFEWLCARLRDALVVIEAWRPSVLSWCERHPQPSQPDAAAAYRRLFGEEESHDR